MSYSEFVRSRFKSGEKIAEEMTAHKAAALDFWSDVLVCYCDTLDKVKKYAIYNKEDRNWYDFVSRERVDRFKDFTLTPQQCELLHAAIGIAGEAGELLDAVRKHVFDGQPLDRENVIEELGDIDFYLTAARLAAKTDLGEVLTYNQAKLTKRYESGYSDKAAQERADKAGAE